MARTDPRADPSYFDTDWLESEAQFFRQEKEQKFDPLVLQLHSKLCENNESG